MKEGGSVESLTIPNEFSGMRTDAALASLLKTLTRSQIQKLIDAGLVLVDGKPAKASKRLSGGEEVTVKIPPPEPIELVPEEIALSIIYEDDHIVVINKPPGMSVHPGAGTRTGTLVNALLVRCHGLSGIGGKLRPGIVHRLDKDTSGVMVVAKNDLAHNCLASQFKARTVKKKYLAVVLGRLRGDHGYFEKPIGRHPTHRMKMTTSVRGAKEAFTEWRVIERLPAATLVEVYPKTGRTHQIRVHFKEHGHPILGDRLYGPRKYPTDVLERVASKLKRQALHASSLSFKHPLTGEDVEFHAPLAEDIEEILQLLRTHGG